MEWSAYGRLFWSAARLRSFWAATPLGMLPRIMLPMFWYWAFMGLLIIMRWLRWSFCIWVMCWGGVSRGVNGGRDGRGEAYSGVLDVLGALGGLAGAVLARLEDVPELDPPVEQERVVGHLVLGQQRVGQAGDGVVVHGVDAVGLAAGARLLRGAGGHFHLALDHGARQAVVVVAQEVVVDVRVELLARVHLLVLGWAGHGHVGHDGRAVDRAAVGGDGHVHLRVLQGGAGRGGPAASGAGDGDGERGGRRRATCALEQRRGGGWGTRPCRGVEAAVVVRAG